MAEFENTYDERTGIWTTAADRYDRLMASRPEYEQLDELIYDDPEGAWPVLLSLIGEVDERDGQMLDFIGAGPLEDFVVKHGTRFIDRIDAEAYSRPIFRQCLSYIWLSEGELPDGVLRRLLAITNNSIFVTPRGNSGDLG